jgi:hypothetical protein
VHATSADLSLLELLQQPVTELLGVSQDAATALKPIGVQTIFDLGSSAVFAQAASAVAAASSSLGMLPTDVLDATGQAKPLAEVPNLPIERLRGVSTANANALATALEAPTLRDFVLWPPRAVAHELVSLAAGTELPDGEDDPAEELRPALGEFPTERVYYDTLVMLGTTPPANQVELDKPIPLDPLASPEFGFGTPAIGALATYEQSWFAQGVTLGQMVHSLALAPGEATRVAVIDWARRTSATATEAISESEQLDSATNHSRAASEVQNAVADEMQSGGSIATGWAKSTSSGDNVSGSIGGGIAGTIGEAAGALGFGFGASSSSQESETNSRATSTSWSIGSRSVLASMTQNVNDRTEQHATSVRNRRATAVREVSQSEHEQVSTRIVANYNHMHALTVQYWEVVQLYSVSVQLHKFVRTLFLPFAQLDFTGANAEQLVARFRGQLLAGALTRRVRDLLRDEEGRIEVRTAIRIARPLSIGTLAEANMTVASARLAPMARMAGNGTESAVGHLGTTIVADPVRGTDGGAVSSPTPGVRLTVARPGPIAEVIPGDAKLASIAFEGIGIDRVRVDGPNQNAQDSTFVVSAGTEQVDFQHPIALRQINAILVARDTTADSEGSMVLRYERNGHQSIAVVPLALAAGTNMQTAAFVSGDAVDRRKELLDHLQANRAYYTQAVLSRLDASSISLLLAGISWQGKPLADQVEPNPVAVAGNYLVLRAPAENDEPSGIGNVSWGSLLAERGVEFGVQDMRLVPTPTGGVFAEAVLGRSNAAEKLDITRFWNWQDSPIPLAPTEIAPVSTGSRATDENLAPGQLGAPVINIQPPTALPEPAGMSAVLGALAAGNMFRDMSGLAGTQSLASAASQQTLSAATEAGRINSENYRAATTQATEMGKAAADMYKVLNSGGKGGSGSSGGGSGGSGHGSGGVSGEGARINHGRDMDERGVSGSSRAAGSGGTSSGTAAGSTAGSTAGGTSAGSADGSGGGASGGSGFSRERAYADMNSGYSPDMVASTREALGDGPALPGMVDGAFSRGATGFIEQMLLQQFRTDAEDAGISYQGIDLLPMRRLVLGDVFAAKPLQLIAWVESASRVYVNVPRYIDRYDETVHDQISEAQALGSIRALALASLCHMRRRANKLSANQGKPPVDFKAWIKDEHGFTADDVTWLGQASTKTTIETKLGAIPGFTATLKSTVTERRDWYKDRLNLSSDDARAALIAENLLPKEVKGRTDYSVADLFAGEDL